MTLLSPTAARFRVSGGGSLILRWDRAEEYPGNLHCRHSWEWQCGELPPYPDSVKQRCWGEAIEWFKDHYVYRVRITEWRPFPLDHCQYRYTPEGKVVVSREGEAWGYAMGDRQKGAKAGHQRIGYLTLEQQTSITMDEFTSWPYPGRIEKAARAVAWQDLFRAKAVWMEPYW